MTSFTSFYRQKLNKTKNAAPFLQAFRQKLQLFATVTMNT
jgi:hypothetical protein